MEQLLHYLVAFKFVLRQYKRRNRPQGRSSLDEHVALTHPAARQLTDSRAYGIRDAEADESATKNQHEYGCGGEPDDDVPKEGFIAGDDG
jgi:hypothetical protein